MPAACLAIVTYAPQLFTRQFRADAHSVKRSIIRLAEICFGFPVEMNFPDQMMRSARRVIGAY